MDLTDQYHLPNGDYDDGGYQVGDLVEVYDGRPRLRCIVGITDVYEITFGNIPDKLWKAEACEDFRQWHRAHRAVWPEFELTDDTKLIAFHFELVQVHDK